MVDQSLTTLFLLIIIERVFSDRFYKVLFIVNLLTKYTYI